MLPRKAFSLANTDRKHEFSAMSEELVTKEILPARGILSAVSPVCRATFTDFGRFETFAKSEHLIEMGQATDDLFFVVSGELAVAIHTPEQIVPLGYIHEGETVGEMGFLEGLTGSANVTAMVNSKIWRIHRDSFEQFLLHHPAQGTEILKAMFILLARRARKGNERLSDEEQ